MIIKCAWCEKIIGTREFKKKSHKIPLVTHSICKSCQQELLSGKFPDDMSAKEPQPAQKSPLQ